MNKLQILGIFTFLIVFNSFAGSGRLAVVSDGNIKDPDDICATPISIALIAAFEQQAQLVHYSHSCHLETSEDGRETMMHESLHGAIDVWRGFENTNTFNCNTQTDACVADLTQHINASSADDLLWIVEAGEPDVIYLAMSKAESAKRQYVRVITHHVNNDKGVNYNLSDIEAMEGASPNLRVGIPDQNTLLLKPKDDYAWMRDSEDIRIQFLWSRALAAEGQLDPNVSWEAKNIGKIDPSDAGMVYYWLTGATNGGDKACDPDKIKNKLLPYIAKIPAYPTGELLYSYSSVNFNYKNKGFYLDDKSFTEPLLAIDPDPNDTGNDGVESGVATQIFDGNSGVFDLYFHGIGEKDGEAPIEVYINSTKIGNYTIALSELEWEAGHKFNMTIPKVEINTGDTITIKGKTATTGTEWSRCRWLKIELYGTAFGLWEEKNGYVVIEPEDVVSHTPGKWEISTAVDGYLGNGYIVWTGTDHFNAPTSDYLSFKVKINNPGVYVMNWRNKVGKGNETSEHNDTWVQFPDAADFYMQEWGKGVKYWPLGSGKTPNPNGTTAANYLKVYQYDKNLNWTWSTKSGDHQSGWVMVDFATPGNYELRVAPRSDYHLIDRITLAQREMVEEATNKSTPKSSYSGADPNQKSPVEDIILNDTNLKFKLGTQKLIEASISPANAGNKKINWVSSDSKIVFSNDSILRGLAPGTATITLTSDENPEIKKEITIEVSREGTEMTRIDRSEMKAIYADSWNTHTPEKTLPPEFALDGDPSTKWHTAWKPSPVLHPHEIQFDFGKEIMLDQIDYLPRDNGPNGIIKEYEVYISNDKNNWGEAVKEGILSWGAAPSEDDLYEMRFITFDSTIKGRYLRLIALSEINGGPSTSAAEFYFCKRAEGSAVQDIKTGVKVYPNPASRILTINGLTVNQKITIVNMLGQVVISTNAISDKIELNIENLENGLYIVNTINHSEMILIQ